MNNQEDFLIRPRHESREWYEKTFPSWQIQQWQREHARAKKKGTSVQNSEFCEDVETSEHQKAPYSPLASD